MPEHGSEIWRIPIDSEKKERGMEEGELRPGRTSPRDFGQSLKKDFWFKVAAKVGVSGSADDR